MQMLFYAAQCNWQSRRTGTGGKSRYECFTCAAPEFKRRHARNQIKNQRQYHNAMQQRGAHHNCDKLYQRGKEGCILSGDQLQQEGHDAKWCQSHNPAHQHQHKLQQFLQQNNDVGISLAAHHQSNSQQQCEYHHCKDVALSQSPYGILKQ